MPGKQNTYTLGEFGVNRVKSPIHLLDGELLVAQNADVPFEKGNRGLRKRSGMAKLNEVPLAGAVHSMSWIPLVDPLPTTTDPVPPIDTVGTRLYAPTTSGANTYLTSTDGVTWAASAPFVRPMPSGGHNFYNLVYQHGGFLSTSGAMFFIADDGFGGLGKLKSWNGTVLADATSNDLDDVFWAFSTFTGLRSLHRIDGDVYATGVSGSNNRFIRANGGAWDDSSSGDHSNGHSPWFEFFASAFWEDRLWTPSGTQEMGYWPYAAGVFGAFVDQGIFTSNLGATMLVTDLVATSFGLVLALDRNGQDPEILWKLTTPGGAWVDASPAAPNNKGCWGPMALFNGLLYIGRHTDTFGGAGATYTGCQLWSYDGTTLSLVKDLTTVVTNANEIRSMIVFNGALYLTVYASTDPTHNIVRTADAVTFTVPVAKNTADAERPRGELGFY